MQLYLEWLHLYLFRKDYSLVFKSVTNDPLCIVLVRKSVKYYGQFRVPNLSFRAEWSNTDSLEYKTLSATVKDKVC